MRCVTPRKPGEVVRENKCQNGETQEQRGVTPTILHALGLFPCSVTFLKKVKKYHTKVSSSSKVLKLQLSCCLLARAHITEKIWILRAIKILRSGSNSTTWICATKKELLHRPLRGIVTKIQHRFHLTVECKKCYLEWKLNKWNFSTTHVALPCGLKQNLKYATISQHER